MLGIALLAAASTLAFVDRTELRARDTGGDAAGTDQSADLETDPELRLRVRFDHDDGDFQLFYAPRLILSHFAYHLCGPSSETLGPSSCPDLPNVGASYVRSPTLELLNGGGLSFRHQHARTAIAVTEQATYGTIDAGSLLNQPVWMGGEQPPPVFPIPRFPDIQLKLVTSYGAVAFYEQVTRRIDFQANVSFGVYGGPDNASRLIFPLTESPGLQLKLEDSIAHQDDLIFSAGVDYTSVSTYGGPLPQIDGYGASPAVAANPSSVRGYGEARLRHRWSRRTTTELGLGAVVSYQEAQNDPTSATLTNTTTPYPTAELLTTTTFSPIGGHGQFFAAGRVAPWIDIFDGTVVERAEASLGALSTVGKNTYRAELVGHYVIPTSGSPGRYRFLYAEVDYARRATSTLFFDVGARGGAEFTGEDYTGLALSPPPGSGPAVATNQGASIYEGELFVGVSWKPLPAKL
jgi:hypothetical protein